MPESESKRKKFETKMKRAHELVLDEWPDERVEELAEPVREDPLYRPLAPDDPDREFLEEVKRRRFDLEVEPTGYHHVAEGWRVVAGWEVVEEAE